MPFDSEIAPKVEVNAATFVGTSTQIELEKMYSKSQLLDTIRQEFIEARFENALAEKDIDTDFGIEFLTQLYLHKRADIPTLVGLLKRFFEGYSETPAQACADEIYKMCVANFADWSGVAQSVIMKYNITADVQERIDLFQYPLPMVEEPMEVTNNRMTGYQTIRGSLILKKNHTEDDICLDHINRVNSIPLAINADVVAFVDNQWKNLDHKKIDESDEDYKSRVKAFEKYTSSSKDVIAGIMAQGDRFWMTHKYDKRGRTYCQGYHVTYQGNDWSKACIQFADKELINLDGE